MDIAQLTNAPRDLPIGELTFKVRRLKFREWGILQQWVKDNAEDPLTAAFAQIQKMRRKGVELGEAREDQIVEQAQLERRDWPPQVMTSRWFLLLGDTPGGSTEFLRVFLRVHQPGLTDEQIDEIESGMTAEECNDLFSASLGVVDPPKEEAPPTPAGGADAPAA